jgi:hypothetical protein
MSLIDVRRERKRQLGGPSRPPRLWKQIITFALVAYLIWYLSQMV